MAEMSKGNGPKQSSDHMQSGGGLKPSGTLSSAPPKRPAPSFGPAGKIGSSQSSSRGKQGNG